MKNSKKLLEKKIALDSCRVNGGLAMGSLATCSKFTYGDHCEDKTTTIYDDQGNTLGYPVSSAWQV
ncbi:hypothetical protein [Pedobacter rhizosphaerae]|uniref:Uncharacterized protein n=1 Tax=Pedobacter rhizosphaerae TaxID=390241 RepID=A0A1H9S8Z8_9SPHI|nr:hypothetical protein [Pedobacter rhizosphaerae]SER81441.1 hypothetical protein SAMN04488023_11726 [Pedobacter rhizosphaerae]